MDRYDLLFAANIAPLRYQAFADYQKEHRLYLRNKHGGRCNLEQLSALALAFATRQVPHVADGLFPRTW